MEQQRTKNTKILWSVRGRGLEEESGSKHLRYQDLS